jgi:hypothetical protein
MMHCYGTLIYQHVETKDGVNSPKNAGWSGKGDGVGSTEKRWSRVKTKNSYAEDDLNWFIAGSKTIDFKEFVAMMANRKVKRSRHIEVEEMKEAFAVFDKNSDG